MNRELIGSLQKDLLSENYEVKDAANRALLLYDLGRAKNDIEVNNAYKEADVRSWVYLCCYGLKEGLKTHRKFWNKR